MAEKSTTSPLSEIMASTSPRPGAIDRLRERFSKENKSTPNLLGVKIKRFSEFENYSGRSRGTLGGFSPLPDMGSPDIDSLSLEKQKYAEKECVLTQLTKKIGLGIYTRGRDIAAEKEVREGYVDVDGDERETWYMFYPPPPSPSLALEPRDWESGSSPEPNSLSSSSPLPIVVSKSDTEPKGLPRLSAFTQGSDYAMSNPTSPTSPTDRHTTGYEASHNIDVNALILSAENLAEQYRGLFLTPFVTPRHTSFHIHSAEGISPLPVPSPLSSHPPTRPQTPKTLRKIKRQHSLRKLLDGTPPAQNSLPSPIILNPLPTTTTITPLTFPTPLTPLSATKRPPLTPPPATGSPDFLSNTFTPEPLHPTRLSLAAHPNRSPTPSQGMGKTRKRKMRGGPEAPEPPPRESSQGRGRGGFKEKKVKRHEKDGSKLGHGNVRAWEDVGDRGRQGEGRKYGNPEVFKTRGGVEEGGEGWL